MNNDDDDDLCAKDLLCAFYRNDVGRCSIHANLPPLPHAGQTAL